MAGDYLSRKKLFGSEEFKNIYERKVLPSQWAISEIGNTYTASIFISLASMLTLEGEKTGYLQEGKKIGFGAYGSGSGSLVFSGALSHDYKPVVKGIRLREKLNTREKLLIEEYVERRLSTDHRSHAAIGE
jgi:3-hydroxy-3-methylglutaryl CoA synthase